MMVGESLGPYRILGKLGEGGMGEVYKARDTRLDRTVAIKILPTELSADPERRVRFEREAKSIAGLTHPHICTLHDIGTHDGTTYLVMEHLAGETLAQRLARSPLPVAQALDIAAQVADALDAAHKHGIIHRDIKPANIMVSDSGLVKVLDFGLAKLGDSAGPTGDETRLPVRPETMPGLILGTVAYMSPEQAEGRNVDARSDIFSLGSVLYEMTTGQPAFAGDTTASTLAAILRDEPKPVSQVAPEMPRELERVISRCLRKDPDRRFQHMADLKIALEELKEESGSRVPAPSALPVRRFRRLAWMAGGCALLAALGVAAWFRFLQHPPVPPAASVRTFTGLPGWEARPAFSPDGKLLAFAWNGEEQDNFDVYLQPVDEPAPLRLTSNPAFDYGPVWSPDGHHIAFLRATPAGTEVIRMRVVPGAREDKLHVARIVAADERSSLAWSPNGRFLAIVDRVPTASPRRIFLLDFETRKTQRLTTPAGEAWDGLPAFAPDGGSLAFVRGGPRRPLSDVHVLRISENGEPRGEPRRLTSDNVFVYGLDWTADGRSIVFSSTRGGVAALWRVSAEGGEPERVPVGGNNAQWPSLSRSGGRLSYAEGWNDWNVWRVAAPGGPATDSAAGPLKLTGSPATDQNPAFSPDGRMVVWSSVHSGSHQLWLSNIDGSQPRQLTSHDPPGAAEPKWSPDGTQIAFNGYSRGGHRVGVISVDGGTPRRLTSGNFDEDVLGWSHDGRSVYFGSNRGEAYALWKAPASGGSAVLVAASGVQPVESSDGRFVYYAASDGAEWSIWKVPVTGGSPERVARNGGRPVESFDGKFVYFGNPAGSIWRVASAGGEPELVRMAGPRAEWTLGRSGLYVLDPDAKGGPALEFFPFSGPPAKPVRLPGNADSYLPSPGLSVSPDGRWVLYVRLDRAESDIMLVDNFR